MYANASSYTPFFTHHVSLYVVQRVHPRGLTDEYIAFKDKRGLAY
jgi:hypothetical protein